MTITTESRDPITRDDAQALFPEARRRRRRRIRWIIGGTLFAAALSALGLAYGIEGGRNPTHNTHRISTTAPNTTTALQDAPAPADPGVNFYPESSGSTLAFTSARDGWYIYGSPFGGSLYETTDGGATWNLASSGPRIGSSIDFVDPQHGWIAGSKSGLVQTTDGGKSWTAETQPTTDPQGIFWKLDFVDDQNGYALTAANKLLKTTDGGQTWSSLSPPGAVADVCFSSDSVGFASTNQGIYVSSDGGASWTASYQFQAPLVSGTSFGPQPLSCSGSAAAAIATNGTDATIQEVLQTSGALDATGDPVNNAWTAPLAQTYTNGHWVQSAGPILLGNDAGNFLFMSGPESFGFLEWGDGSVNGGNATAVELRTTNDSGKSFINTQVTAAPNLLGVLAFDVLATDPSDMWEVNQYDGNSALQVLSSTDGGTNWTTAGTITVPSTPTRTPSSSTTSPDSSTATTTNTNTGSGGLSTTGASTGP